MNEKGLTVAVLYVPQSETFSDPAKETIFSLEAVRLMLDQAGSTQEALALLARYNVAFPILPVHYLVADSSGHSAVVEFVGGRMQVINNSGAWQGATNFQQYQSEGLVHKRWAEFRRTGTVAQDADHSFIRYFAVAETLGKSRARFRPEQAMALLQRVFVPTLPSGHFGTQWSVVYHMRDKSLELVMAGKFASPWTMALTPEGLSLITKDAAGIRVR
jgi:choloylglycine hydrolase